MDLLAKKGITLFNAPEGNRDAVGEHGVGMLLMLLNKLRLADQEVRSYLWDRESNRGHELKNKVVGIFGFGFMGSAFAEKLRGFDCEIIAYDKYKKGYTSDINYVNEVDLTDFLQDRFVQRLLSIDFVLVSLFLGKKAIDSRRQFPFDFQIGTQTHEFHIGS